MKPLLSTSLKHLLIMFCTSIYTGIKVAVANLYSCVRKYFCSEPAGGGHYRPRQGHPQRPAELMQHCWHHADNSGVVWDSLTPASSLPYLFFLAFLPCP